MPTPIRVHVIAGGFPPGKHTGHDIDYARMRILQALQSNENVHATVSSDSPPMVVVGAGLAGLSAAIDLAEAGRRTLLIERRPFAGGKAYSFRDPRSGVEFDNGQHIYLRCCTAYIGLLRKLGLAWDVRVPTAEQIARKEAPVDLAT